VVIFLVVVGVVEVFEVVEVEYCDSEWFGVVECCCACLRELVVLCVVVWCVGECVDLCECC